MIYYGPGIVLLLKAQAEELLLLHCNTITKSTKSTLVMAVLFEVVLCCSNSTMSSVD